MCQKPATIHLAIQGMGFVYSEIIVLLAKTGVRRSELIRLDVNDVEWENYKVVFKKTSKRSNRIVFFDDEAALVLKRWLKVRKQLT